MFENAYHQAAQDGAAYQSITILQNARRRMNIETVSNPPAPGNRPPPPPNPPAKKCGKHCFDKPCSRNDCPLGE